MDGIGLIEPSYYEYLKATLDIIQGLYDLSKKLDKDIEQLNIEISRLEKNPRTTRENEALMAIRLINRQIQDNPEQEKTEQILRLVRL